MKFRLPLKPNITGLIGFLLLIICVLLQIVIPHTSTLEFVTGFLGALSCVLIGWMIYHRIVRSAQSRIIKSGSARRSRTWW